MARPKSNVVQHLEAGVQSLNADNPAAAKTSFLKALKQAPNNADALHLTGLAYNALGSSNSAVRYIEKALSVAGDNLQFLNNLGQILRNNGQAEQACSVFGRALNVAPGNLDVLNNMGNACSDIGDTDKAIECFKAIIETSPRPITAHYNLGNVYLEAKQAALAGDCFRQVLAFEPRHFEAQNNLGLCYLELDELGKACEELRQVITSNPQFAEAHYNLGNALQKRGQLEEAVDSFHNALNIKPDYPEAWANLKFIAQALQDAETGGKDRCVSGLSAEACATADFALLEYYLNDLKRLNVEENVKKAMAALPAQSDEEVVIDGKTLSPEKLSRYPEKVVALLHFGRSGTGLLHSLIDGHPEISALPSIYLRGYFNAGVWDRISADGWRGLPERFVDEFAVLFDARSPKPTPGKLGEDSVCLGQKEGMANVGDDRDEALVLDRDKFCSEALRLMKGRGKIDPGSFLLIAHAALEKVMSSGTEKHTVFYHIHNPNDFALLNFMRYVSDTRLMIMVREPVQSCESWIREEFQNSDYSSIVHKIITMLFAIDQPAFRMQDSVGIRLEDLKNRPEETIRSLCTWLGIEETESLYQMTALGRKWWGDPSSPDYDPDKAMSPFGKSSIQRRTGSIFSEQDQFVLGTLFYPFSARFGYRQPDQGEFENHLKDLRPLLDEPLDFERAMAGKSGAGPENIKCGQAFRFFHAGLIERWRTLDRFGDYPGLLTPLDISGG